MKCVGLDPGQSGNWIASSTDPMATKSNARACAASAGISAAEKHFPFLEIACRNWHVVLLGSRRGNDLSAS
jgi:hypothetical protein